VPEAEKARFAAFVEAHPLGELVADGLRVPYLFGGTGERIVLVLTAAHATPFQAYDSVLRLETESRVLVVDVGECSSLDEVARCADCVLDAEGLGHVVAFGQSVSGILAQAYAMRSASRLDGMVLAQTVPPKRENNRLAALRILRVLPMGLLRRLIKRKLGRLADVDVPLEVKARRAMSLALLSDTVDNVLTKKRLMNAIRLIFEFNREEDYGAVAREAWRGRVLLFTSEDDPGFADVDRIVRALPRTEVHVLRRGAGHLAPAVHSREYYDRISLFLRSL